MYTNYEAVRKAIDKFNQIERDDYGDLSLYIAEEAESEAYENDKQLHSLFAKYRNDDDALNLIDETLICVCGWGIESLINRII